MKKETKIKLGAGLLVLTLFSACLMARTFSRYVMNAGAGVDAARVADFAFSINGTTIQSEANAVDISDLFKASYLDGDVENKSVTMAITGDGEYDARSTYYTRAGNEGSYVYTMYTGGDTDFEANRTTLYEGTEDLIAPGTDGFVKIGVKNEGEVAIVPSWVITETNASNVPLKYAITTDGVIDEDVVWNAPVDGKITITPADGDHIDVNTEKESYLHWKWVTATNAADTALGTMETLPTVSVSAVCTVMQYIDGVEYVADPVNP